MLLADFSVSWKTRGSGVRTSEVATQLLRTRWDSEGHFVFLYNKNLQIFIERQELKSPILEVKA